VYNERQEMSLRAIAMQLNGLSRLYAIGGLQSLRKRIKNLKRLALGGGAIFHDITISDDEEWAFHYGGRTELQFNIGLQQFDGVECLRYGVAFSLEPSQTLPDVSKLYEKIRRFNEFMRLYPEAFPGFRICHHDKRWSPWRNEKQIHPEQMKSGVFIFFGDYMPLDEFEPGKVLNAFDELLPLYEYVEGPQGTEPLQTTDTQQFQFTAGELEAKTDTQYTREQRVIDVSLRHIEIQQALLERLRSEHGAENVGCEQCNGAGMRIDIVVRRSKDQYWYYEVKTSGTARACIREALGQLLEYSYWPEAQRAARLIVVGEAPFDLKARNYIRLLQSQFNIPIEYQQQLVSKRR